MLKIKTVICFGLLALLLITSCGEKTEDLKQLDENEFFVYQDGDVALKIEE